MPTKRDYQRYARRGTTAQRGYSYAHQKLRRQLLERFRPGDPCAHCGRPMWNPQLTDLGHTADRTAYIGLAHRRCNRGDGARRGNQQRRTVTTWRTARQW